MDLPASRRLQLRAPATSLHFDPQPGTCTPAGTFQLSSLSGASVNQINVSVMGRVRFVFARPARWQAMRRADVTTRGLTAGSNCWWYCASSPLLSLQAVAGLHGHLLRVAGR